MKIILIVLSLLCISVGQEPLDYFPFHEGDIWQYYDTDGVTINKTILSDSCGAAGNHYLEYKIEYMTLFI